MSVLVASVRGRALGPQFRTKDVSNHPEVTRALQRFLSDFNYHAAVGKALSGNRRSLGIELRSTTSSNATWGKAAADPVPASAPVPADERPDPHDLGQQRRRAVHRADAAAPELVPRDCVAGAMWHRAAGGEPVALRQHARRGRGRCRAELPDATRSSRCACTHRAGRRRRAISMPSQHALEPADVLQPLRPACRRPRPGDEVHASAACPERSTEVTEVRIEYAPLPPTSTSATALRSTRSSGTRDSTARAGVPRHRDEADRVVLAG